MTVYVDNMRLSARPAGYRGPGTPRWSHLFADTPDELHDFARRIGLNPAWLQHPGTHREHYDVTDTKRNLAIRSGARPLGYPSGVAALMQTRRALCQCTALASCRWAQLTNGATTP